MKRVIQFNKAYPYAVAGSLVIIIAGLVGWAFMGFNLGVDFKGGVNQDVQLAFHALDLSYQGAGNVTLKVSSDSLMLVYSGAGVEAKNVTLPFKEYTTIGAIAEALPGKAPGIAVKTVDNGALASTLLLQTSTQDSNLAMKDGQAVIARVFRAVADKSESFADVEKVRASMTGFGAVSIQEVGDPLQQRYMIRVQDDGKDPNFARTISGRVTESLEKVFGKDRAVTISSNTMGAAASKDLAGQSVWLTLAAVAAIMAYCWIRFRWQFGLGAVLSTVHDLFIMITFVVFTRMEFNATSIAAILTVLGYSINDTIVVFDRVREDRKLDPTGPFVDVVNRAITETLSRTFITTLTVILCVLSLIVFTVGDIQRFAIMLFVGIVSGTYSTIFVANAFIVAWERMRLNRNARREAKMPQGTGQKKAIAQSKPAKA